MLIPQELQLSQNILFPIPAYPVNSIYSLPLIYEINLACSGRIIVPEFYISHFIS